MFTWIKNGLCVHWILSCYVVYRCVQNTYIFIMIENVILYSSKWPQTLSNYSKKNSFMDTTVKYIYYRYDIYFYSQLLYQYIIFTWWWKFGKIFKLSLFFLQEMLLVHITLFLFLVFFSVSRYNGPRFFPFFFLYTIFS